MEASDLVVEAIIEKVMIRNTSGPFQYAPKRANLSTPQQHIWHYQLQQENYQLRDKIKELKQKVKRKEEEISYQSELEAEAKRLKKELEKVLNFNTLLQKDVNKARLKNQQVQKSETDQLQDSLLKNKSKRKCTCSNVKALKSQKQLKDFEGRQVKAEEFPRRQNLKKNHDISINCQILGSGQPKGGNKILGRVSHLRNVIAVQQRLIQSYQLQLTSLRRGTSIQGGQNLSSASRNLPLRMQTSVKRLKGCPIGSIVKVRRE